MSGPNNLAEAFPIEQKRCRNLLQIYRGIPTGAFGAMMIERVLEQADQAAASGDVIAMLRAYHAMQDCQ